MKKLLGILVRNLVLMQDEHYHWDFLYRLNNFRIFFISRNDKLPSLLVSSFVKYISNLERNSSFEKTSSPFVSIFIKKFLFPCPYLYPYLWLYLSQNKLVKMMIMAINTAIMILSFLILRIVLRAILRWFMFLLTWLYQRFNTIGSPKVVAQWTD